MKHHKLLFVIVVFFGLLGLLMSPALAEVEVKSGGVGIENRVDQGDFPLKLVFFEKGGPFLANVAVEIFDTKGQMIVNEVSIGPWMYVKLPEGKYKVIATRKSGEQQGIFLDLGSTQTEVSLAFEQE